MPRRKFKWYYSRGGKRHLTKKAREYLSRKARRRVRARRQPKAERKVQKNVRQVWHVKANYDSPRGSSHDKLFDFTITTVRKSRLESSDIGDLADTYIRAFEERDGFQDIPFNKVVIGLESETETDEDESTTHGEVSYSSTIED